MGQQAPAMTAEEVTARVMHLSAQQDQDRLWMDDVEIGISDHADKLNGQFQNYLYIRGEVLQQRADIDMLRADLVKTVETVSENDVNLKHDVNASDFELKQTFSENDLDMKNVIISSGAKWKRSW